MNSYNLTTKNPKQLNCKMAKGGTSGFGECIHVPGGCGHVGSLGAEVPGPRNLLYSNLYTLHLAVLLYPLQYPSQ